ncbi:hypothetical protein PHBOTO_003960 [Pseudozyma hubeiensis]|nr:hypothetical protein PHBOTO_003960 [Pseudozyma hubeiensis]
MLQSNTNASSFKLQPAPRPKSKKRPQNAPPVSSSTDASTPSDAGSVRSCFEDDEDSSEEEAALTPKASLFTIPLVSPKSASPTVVTPGTCRHRSSTLSTSARSTSSVHRLLNAMSIPLSPSTRPLSTASSPSATVSIMLTSKSPTPSSPLFPRRTLMRSLSSTCINTSSRSSPTSPPSNLRKRMGWRGFSSAARADELSILLSPGSPLTPRRAEQLHTPTQASIDSLLHHPEEEEMEPLSATLKALGAKRKTHRFGETSPPGSAYDVKSPDTSFATTVGEFEVMTAERKIFNLPTWVRFEANHHARTKVVEENRLAVAAGEALKVAGVGTEVKRNASIKEKEGFMGPKTSQLGDVAPSSPNGSLLGGFDFDTPTRRVEAPKQQQEEEEVVSVVRRLPTAAIRGMDSSSRADGKVKSSFASVFRSALHPLSRRIKPCSVDERRDGWGGILTRTSWFPSHSKGPLVSPSPGKGLKKMLLQPRQEDDEWEDVLEPKHSRTEERSFLEMNEKPRWKIFRARPVHPDPPYELNTWHTRPLPKDDVTASQLITTRKSVENRPISTQKWGKTRKLVLVIVTVCLVALVINVVVVKETGSKSVTSGDGNRKVFDPLVGNIDGLKLAPATAATMGPVDPSVAKAAHMSQP